MAGTTPGKQLLQRIPFLMLHEPIEDLVSEVAHLWQTYSTIVFCFPIDQVVGLIAPHISSSSSDPTVVVVEASGKWVITLWGSPIYAQEISGWLDAAPMENTPDRTLHLQPIDQWGVPFGWNPGDGDWEGVRAALKRGVAMEVIQEVGSALWKKGLPSDHPFCFDSLDHPGARVWISHRQRRFTEASDFPMVQWHPRVLWVGIDCAIHTSAALILKAISTALQIHHLAEGAIAGIATIEEGEKTQSIQALAHDRGWGYQVFPRALFSPSIANLSEAIALRAAGKNSTLLASKQVFEHTHQEGSVTIGVAMAPEEFIPSPGKLWLISMGPGQAAQMTTAALQALGKATVVIGNQHQLKPMAPELPPGQIYETEVSLPESQWIAYALNLCRWGLQVALISAGDVGIYDRASQVFDLLVAQEWDGLTPAVEVLPGISALQAAAARVGAPLSQDFCAINLSDLTTPVELIQNRVEAAAVTDFVIALYNPRSRSRITPLILALEILRHHRSGDTPVAVVKSPFQAQEEILLTTLQRIDIARVDMFTTILIGNSSAFFYHHYLISPNEQKYPHTPSNPFPPM